MAALFIGMGSGEYRNDFVEDLIDQGRKISEELYIYRCRHGRMDDKEKEELRFRIGPLAVKVQGGKLLAGMEALEIPKELWVDGR